MPAFKCIPYADSLIAAADIVYLEMVCLNDTIVFERHRAMQEAIEGANSRRQHPHGQTDVRNSNAARSALSSQIQILSDQTPS